MNLNAVATDPHLDAVVAVFDTYFTGINTKRYNAAASVFAPGGDINPSDPAQVEHFAATTSSTIDDRITIRSIRPASINGRGGLLVVVDFRSRQTSDQGYDGQTCSLWHIPYELAPVGSGYGLLTHAGQISPVSCA